MTRVMMVVEATAGGTLRHVLNIATGSHQRGIAVHVVCATRRNPAARAAIAALRDAGVAVDQIDMRREIHPCRDAAATILLRRRIAEIGPDVVHLHSSKAGALGRAAVAGMGRGRPFVVYSPHAYAFLTQPGRAFRWMCRCIERALLSWTDCVVAVSRSEAQAATMLGGDAAVLTIPNGVDASRGAPLPGPREATAPLRIGWLGRLVWQKNPHAAVRLSVELSRRGVRHELLLGGDGSDQPGVVSLIRRLRCGNVVRVLGFVTDTDAFHAGIDVLLMTSRGEGLPYVGLDAMANGRAIIGFDVPGIRDLIEPGVTGLLAPEGDVETLAAQLERMARDPTLRAALGSAARQRVRRHFSFERQLRAICQLYESRDFESSRQRAAS